MNIIDVLVQKGVLEERELADVQHSIVLAGGDVEEGLIKHGVNPREILAAKAEVYDIPSRNMEGQTVPFDVLKFVSHDAASSNGFVPIGIADNVLEVGIVNPDNLEARDLLNFISSKINKPYKLFLITQEDYEHVLEMYKDVSMQMGDVLKQYEDQFAEEGKAGDRKGGTEGGGEEGIGESTENVNMDGQFSVSSASGTKIIEDAPVNKIVTTILHYAVEGNASDIHIEPMGDSVRVRFRVDGVLNTSLVLPPKIQSALVARIKIASNMRLDEKRKPQDGRFYAPIDGRKIDFRVSTFPSYFGEKIVLRILDSEKGVKKLDKLGLSERNEKLIRAAIEKPYGLILISGPTGSGKSTTLYSMLNEVDRETQNVLSLEDPVEYTIPGMNQSQVRPEIGYTFANGLRSTLRQDPDIIMVGEIRDKETAQLAVQAALTGHLVFSTIHTNNAAGVIPRLIDMGVDPFLIAPTLVLAIAQRLAKQMCPGAGRPVALEDSMKLMMEKDLEDLPEEFRKTVVLGDKVYTAEATAECPTGTSGRIAVMEVLEMTKELEKIILTNPTEIEIMKTARKQGMLTMKEDAMIKAFNGTIPFEEVNRL